MAPIKKTYRGKKPGHVGIVEVKRSFGWSAIGSAAAVTVAAIAVEIVVRGEFTRESILATAAAWLGVFFKEVFRDNSDTLMELNDGRGRR